MVQKLVQSCTDVSWDATWLSIPGERLKANDLDATPTTQRVARKVRALNKLFCGAAAHPGTSKDLSDFLNVQASALLEGKGTMTHKVICLIHI